MGGDKCCRTLGAVRPLVLQPSVHRRLDGREEWGRALEVPVLERRGILERLRFRVYRWCNGVRERMRKRMRKWVRRRIRLGMGMGMGKAMRIG